MAATEITGQTITVFVGQQIHLRPGINKNWGVLVGGKTKWTLPGDARIVRNYHGDGPSIAYVTELAESDKSNDEIIFYFVDGTLGGKSREVKADCVFKGSDGAEVAKTVSATFLVKAPELIKGTSTTDQVGLFPPGQPKADSLRFGEITKIKHSRQGERVPGIKWNWEVKVPDGVDAEIKDVQVKKAGCISKQVRRDNHALVWHGIPGERGPTSQDQLDTSNPYTQPGDFNSPGFPRKVVSGGTCTEHHSLDSPRDPLSRFEEVERYDIFEYFVMYRPDDTALGGPTIWIPIARAKWFWRGHVQLIDKKMVLVDSSHSTDPPLEPTLDFPQYQSNWLINREER